MNHALRISVVLLLMAALSACVTPYSRKTDLQAAYPAWNDETLRKVSWGVVDIGMTKEQAREALKVPQRYNLVMQGDKWSYVDDFTGSQLGGVQEWGHILFFDNDRIAKIHGFWRNRATLMYVEWDAAGS